MQIPHYALTLNVNAQKSTNTIIANSMMTNQDILTSSLLLTESLLF